MAQMNKTASEISDLLELSETTQNVLDRYFRDTTKIKSTLEQLQQGLACQAHLQSKEKMIKPKPHMLYLDDNHSFFRIEKKKTRKGNVLLKDIKKVVAGKSFSDSGAFFKYAERLKSKKKTLEYNNDWTVTIQFGGSAHEQLDIAFTKVDEFISFLVSVNYLLRSIHLKNTPPLSVIMMRYWMMADENNDNKLSIQEVEKLFKNLNIEISHNYLKRNFNRFDTDKSGALEFSEFIEMFREMNVIDEIEGEFSAVTNSALINFEEFTNYLKFKQKQMTISSAEVTEFMKKNGAVSIDEQLYMPSFEFTSYIFSHDNSLANPTLFTLHHDMNQPLTSYFIASSHNTYLSGHQLKGESDVKNYRNGLLSGSRCVELDCWNGDNGEVVIYHGRTLTSKILFEDVIKCVNEYGFKTSPFPIILSLDVHADIPGQEKMAEIMIRIFGDRLLMPDLQMTQWPSPNDLRGKIIIKNKKVPSSSSSVTASVKQDQDSDSDSSDEDFAESSSPVPVVVEQDKPEKKKKHPKVKVAQKLSDITALGTTKLTTFEEVFKLPCNRMFSISEGKVEKLLQNDCANIIKFNQNHFSRSYPHGLRFDSSNYDPFPSFITGVQMSALNTQTHCAFYRMNEFKFKENAMSGYLLKPKLLRVMGEAYPDENSPIQKHLELKIIMAKQVPKAKGADKGEIVDPFVKVSILGHPRDRASFNTTTVWDNGWNPTFNSTFEFDIVEPELACLQISIWDKNKVSADKFICENIIPVTALREGALRSVQMYDEDMNLIEGCYVLCSLDISKRKFNFVGKN